MTKEENYIRSQQHFEDNVNAYYDQKESEQSQQDNREQVDDRCQMTDILNELESLRSENERMKAEREWIEIDDILNVPAGKLIMLSTDKWITTGFRYHIHFEADNADGVRIYPTHWMPLPEPPKQ